MTKIVDRAGLKVAEELALFLEQKALPGTGVDAAKFWTGVASIFAKFAPENRALLKNAMIFSRRSMPGMWRAKASRRMPPPIRPS